MADVHYRVLKKKWSNLLQQYKVSMHLLIVDVYIYVSLSLSLDFSVPFLMRFLPWQNNYPAIVNNHFTGPKTTMNL